MTYEELKRELADIGIDIEKDRYELGLDYYDCGDLYCKNDSGYVHIRKGDKDNGKVVEIFETEADFIKAIISHIRAYTHNKRNRFRSKREKLNEILEKAKERN